jgi:MarR family transcriptional regulator, transcriptional regulator for hemolysin
MEQVRHFGFIVKDVYRLWVRLFEQRVPQLGMTFTQCKVLVFLSRNEGTTQAKLAEASDTEPMTLVRVLDRMERDGWIERRPDPADRRAYRLYLKPASAPVLNEVQHIGEKARSEALAGLSGEQREQMTEMLEHVRRNLVAMVSAGEPNGHAEGRGARQNGKHNDSQNVRRVPSRTTRTRRKASS